MVSVFVRSHARAQVLSVAHLNKRRKDLSALVDGHRVGGQCGDMCHTFVRQALDLLPVLSEDKTRANILFSTTNPS